jgi:molybdopterin/thiamine biosynthesis adenylyltransferase
MKPIAITNLKDFKEKNQGAEIIDQYSELIEEVFLIRNPKYKFGGDYKQECGVFVAGHCGGKPMEAAGQWFYFSRDKKIVHYLPDALHQELRTARNKNIITAEEQKKFYDFVVGIAGMSVGSHPALTISMMGGARRMKIADPDTISGSNLNRVRYDFTKIGESKCEIVEELIYKMNPYAEVHAYSEGVNEQNIAEFFDGPPKLDVLVEEVDNLEMKIRLRLEAKKRGIPVIMATDNGDNVIVDIERYDTDTNLQLFNGAAGDLTLQEFKQFPPMELPRLATKIAGPKLVVPRMLESLFQVGKTLYSWPQTGDAATLAGVAVAYTVKRLALGEPLKSGKTDVNLDAVFDPHYFEDSSVTARDARRKELLGQMGL